MKSETYIKYRNLRRNIRAYWLLVIIIAAAIGYYSFTQFSDLMHKTNAINHQSAAFNDLENERLKEEAEFKSLKEQKKDFEQKLENDVNQIVPAGENFTNLTRDLDAFFLGLSKSNNPIFVSNLQYGSPAKDPSGELSYLPVNLTIESSKDNFFNFLNYIEESGNLNDKVRLMDIQSIKINFKNGGTGGEVSLNVSLNAYFRSSQSN